MDIGARALRLEEGGGGAARIEAALQMHREYRVEILRTHFVEEHVAQVSGIVHHCVDAAETIDRGPAHRAHAVPVGDAVMIGARPAARSSHFRPPLYAGDALV